MPFNYSMKKATELKVRKSKKEIMYLEGWAELAKDFLQEIQ